MSPGTVGFSGSAGVVGLLGVSVSPLPLSPGSDGVTLGVSGSLGFVSSPLPLSPGSDGVTLGVSGSLGFVSSPFPLSPGSDGVTLGVSGSTGLLGVSFSPLSEPSVFVAFTKIPPTPYPVSLAELL